MTARIPHTVLCLLLSLASPGNVFAGSDALAYQDWLRKPSSELLRMGNWYCNEGEMVDSAMVCYSIIADRYTPQAPKEEKALAVRALNELGVLNTTYYNNHTAAYRNLLLAHDISKEIGLEEMEPYILLNLGNLYGIYEFLFPTGEQVPQAGQYYEQCFRTSCRLHLWDMTINSYINFVMLNMPYGVGDASVHQVMAAWLRDSIPYSTADWQLAAQFVEGNLAIIDNNPLKAKQHYCRMMDELEPGMVREQYMVYTCLEAACLSEQRYDSAVVYANRILQLQSLQDLTDIRAETYRFLSEYYTNMGNAAEATRCHAAYLETKELLMKNIVGLVPTRLSHDLELVKTEIGRMREHERMQRINLTVAIVIIAFLFVFTLLIIRKNRQMNEKNTALYRQMKEILHAEKPAPDVQKYKESQLKEEKKQKLVEHIMQVMNDTDAICQPSFTLQSLAERVNSNTSYVSQAVNEHFGISFTNLLNQYRVREACRRMEDHASYGKLTIDAISESVGFKARITFTKAFRQNVGMLPSEYLKAAKQDS